MADIAPFEIVWRDRDESQPALFAADSHLPCPTNNIRVPAAFVKLAKAVACHSDESRWNLLYRVLWRIVHGEHNLLKVETDDDVAELIRMRKQVSREVHKMHAFVRFRKVEQDGEEVFVSWYEPRHHVVRAAVPFFVERFNSMKWSILTPTISAHWDKRDLRFGPGVPRSESPRPDELEAWWRGYYASIFNPARTNLRAMRAEMPRHFWKNMPELEQLPQLLDEAPARVGEMIRRQRQAPGAAPFVPEARELRVLQQAVRSCTGCALHECATQAVFGEGPIEARLVLIGEQPGDEEDRAGRPFVGPAGEILNQALQAAKIDRSELYVTNAVKHFKFVERGKRRIHQTPRAVEIAACRPWLQAEMESLRPQVVVCLGATAAKTVFGHQFRLTEQRGQVLGSTFAERTIATFHPSAVLRAEVNRVQEDIFGMLVRDLSMAREALKSVPVSAML